MNNRDDVALVPFPLLEERQRASLDDPPPAADGEPDTDQPADIPTLVVDGQAYGGWTELRVTRGLERCAADFDIALTERFPGRATAWPLGPFTALEVRLGADPVLAGYVDVWAPQVTATQMRLRISGRSKTADLIDCCPASGTGEYRQNTLEAVARAMADPYGITVENLAGDAANIPLIAFERTDTCFSILEKAARQRGVLLTDGPAGQLRIVRGPQADAAPVATLELGVNIREARLKLDVSKRFQTYEARTQAGVAATRLPPPGQQPPIDGYEAAVVEARRPQQDATRAISTASGGATDPDVPRKRIMVIDAEAAGDGVTAGQRAVWECARRAGESVRLSVILGGWRRPDKRLWSPGDTVAVRIRPFRLDRNLVIAKVTWIMDANGQRCELEMAAPEAFLPEPIPPARGGTASARLPPTAGQQAVPGYVQGVPEPRP